MSVKILRNCLVFDGRSEALIEGGSIVAEIMQKGGLVGSIEPGAYADLIAIDKNPLQAIHVMAKPDENFSMIMKEGAFVRNRAGQSI